MTKVKSVPLAFVAFAVFSFVGGCASTPSVHPDAVVLQDALPGQALVYLLRAPHDGMQIRVQSGDKTLITLPAESYTALSVPAGRHVFTTFSTSPFVSNTPVAPPLDVTLVPDQRVFYAISGVTERSIGFGGLMPIAGGGVMPIFIPQSATASGSRVWKEFSELDARGLITVSRVALPDR
ncbi:MAG: hypothetical protein V4625_14990 [Pseudomonadota bacterium]